MNLKLLLPILLILFASGCSSPNQQERSSTPFPSPINISTSIPELTTTPNVNSPPFLQFQIVNANPIKTIQFNSLQLDRPTIIFAVETLTQKLFRFSSPTFTPSPMTNIPAKARMDSIVFSPDGKWFIYLVFKSKDQNGLAHYELWLMSVAKSDQTLIVNDLDGDFSTTWVSNEQIAVWRKYSRSFDCPQEIRIINPFLKEERVLPSLPTESEAYCFPLPLFNPDMSKAIYLENNIGWKQVNYESMSTSNVLSTLMDKDISPASDKYFSWGLNGLNFAFPDSDSNQIRFARNLDETGITSSKEFQYIRLPENTSLTGDYFEWWNLERGLVAFDLKMGTATPSTLNFAIANLDDLTLKKYDIDRNSFAEYQGMAWNILSSTNSRFLSWAIMKSPENYPALGSVILDTQTGEVSFLKNYQVVGFGKSQP